MSTARFWVQVKGPHTTGAFGVDSHEVVDRGDVLTGPSGEIVIEVAPREGGTVLTSQGVRTVKARPAMTVIYPKGEAYQITVGPLRDAR